MASSKSLSKTTAYRSPFFRFLFFGFLGQTLSGWSSYNGSPRAVHIPALGFGAYLGTGNFLDGVYSTWQAAILQSAVIIAFGSALRQQGAAHSRKADHVNRRTLSLKLRPHDTFREQLYANSLSLTLITLFTSAASITLKTLGGIVTSSLLQRKL